MRPQALLNQQNIMQRRDNREEESCAQELGSRNPYPAQWPDTKQHYEKHCGNLRKSVRFPENAGPEITQSRDGKQYSAGGQYRNIAAENQDRIFPGNLVQN
jgi:hypothetical protein